MAIIFTSGILCTATGSTATQVALSGKAEILYLSVQSRTFVHFEPTTSSTGTGENLGLNLASGYHYAFQFPNGIAKYMYHVSSTPLNYGIMEVC